MSKMNNNQLQHLSSRLNTKIRDAKTTHPNTQKIQDLESERLALSDLTGTYQILSKTTKTQLQELLKDLLTAPGAVYRNPLISKIHELPAAAPINARIAQLNVKINLLQEEREADITKLRAKRDAVYDQAVFADSPEEVLKTIEAFMAS